MSTQLMVVIVTFIICVTCIIYNYIFYFNQTKFKELNEDLHNVYMRIKWEALDADHIKDSIEKLQRSISNLESSYKEFEENAYYHMQSKLINKG